MAIYFPILCLVFHTILKIGDFFKTELRNFIFGNPVDTSLKMNLVSNHKLRITIQLINLKLSQLYLQTCKLFYASQKR
jgi:hypothetical protein